MNDEITLEYNGKTYTTEYSIDGDSLILYLPAGQQIITTRGGLSIEAALKPHFLHYLKQHVKN